MSMSDGDLENRIRKAYGRDLPGEELDRAVLDRLEEEGGGVHEISAAPPPSFRRIGVGVAAAAALAFVVLYGLFTGPNEAERELAARGAAAGDVVGKVRGPRGKPIKGAHVLGVVKTWSGGYRQVKFATETGGKGKFRLEKLYPAEEKFAVHLTVVADGFAFESGYYFQANGGALKPLEFNLAAAHPVTLRFVDEAGAPVRGVTVYPSGRKNAGGDEFSLYSQAAGPVHATSDAQGGASMSCFEKGDSAEITVRFPGRDGETRDFTVGDDVVTIHQEKADQDRNAGSDVADIPSELVKIGGDEKKRYFRIGPMAGEKAPRDGYALVLVLPGGDGSAEFLAFVKRIRKFAFDRGYILAQPVAVKWTDGQSIIWPTAKSKVRGMKFSTEEFIADVVADVAASHKIDKRRVFTLGWSSSGPAQYAAALETKTPVTGSFIAMSVFKPHQLPPLRIAKGRAFYILHSPDDNRCPYRMAEDADEKLRKAGAKVEFATYAGGHGWHGDVYGMIKKGVEWLEKAVK